MALSALLRPAAAVSALAAADHWGLDGMTRPLHTTTPHHATMHVPTISEVMADHSSPCGAYRWDVEGGRIGLPRAVLLAALELAHDPSMPEWPAMVEQYLPTD